MNLIIYADFYYLHLRKWLLESGLI